MPNDGAKFIEVIFGARFAAGVGVGVGVVGVLDPPEDDDPDPPPQATRIADARIHTATESLRMGLGSPGICGSVGRDAHPGRVGWLAGKRANGRTQLFSWSRVLSVVGHSPTSHTMICLTHSSADASQNTE